MDDAFDSLEYFHLQYLNLTQLIKTVARCQLSGFLSSTL